MIRIALACLLLPMLALASADPRPIYQREPATHGQRTYSPDKCGKLMVLAIEAAVDRGEDLAVVPPPGCLVARFAPPYALASSANGTVLSKGGRVLAVFLTRRDQPAAPISPLPRQPNRPAGRRKR